VGPTKHCKIGVHDHAFLKQSEPIILIKTKELLVIVLIAFWLFPKNKENNHYRI